MTQNANLNIVLDNLCFGEGPRWHDGHLWLSDMHSHEVLRLDEPGKATSIVEVPNCPSGLGWLPDGRMLVVSMEDRKLMCWDGSALTVHADLSDLAPYHCNDMVVDQAGRAYVGNFGFNLHRREKPRTTGLICVEPNGDKRVVAENLMFPNGAVITPDGKTLIVAETFASQLSAFSIAPNGDLSQHRVWAPVPDKAVPDGICLDAGGGIWVASPTTNNCLRLLEGGEVSHRVELDRGAFACMLGGQDLYILAAGSSVPKETIDTRSGQVIRTPAPYPGAGLP